MTVANGDFEEQAAGGHLGTPADWTVNVVAGEEVFAEFFADPTNDPALALGQETYSGWYLPEQATFAGYHDDLTLAIFNASGAPTFVEDYEQGWPVGMRRILAPVLISAGVETYEDLYPDWDAVDSEAMVFVPDVFIPVEVGEVGGAPTSYPVTYAWGGEEIADWTDVAGDPAVFTWREPSFGVYATSDFERYQLWAEQLVTADATANTFALVAHGLVAADKVTFRNEGGQLPDPLVRKYEYWIKGGAPANAFQVAAESGGAAIDLNDAGVGVHYVSLVHRGTWPALT